MARRVYVMQAGSIPPHPLDCTARARLPFLRTPCGLVMLSPPLVDRIAVCTEPAMLVYQADHVPVPKSEPISHQWGLAAAPTPLLGVTNP